MSADTDRAWQSTPSLSERPAGEFVPSRVLAGASRDRPDRRAVLRVTATLGGVAALSVLGWLPPARLRRAGATAGNEHLNCADDDSVSGCDDSAVCVGAPYSQRNCGPDGWFPVVADNPDWAMWPVPASGAFPTPKRNARRWTHAGTPWRCTDGLYQERGSMPELRICGWPAP
jgi:hypothetical protein